MIPSAPRPPDTLNCRGESAFALKGRWQRNHRASNRCLQRGVGRLIDPDVREKLERADWERITLTLVRYALFKVRRLKWHTGDRESLPEGKTAEDLACEAIEKVVSGDRRWDPTTCPDLLRYLKGVVDSLVSHLVVSEEHRRVRRMPQTDEGQEVEELLTMADPTAETAEHLVSVQVDLETRVVERLAAERFVDALFDQIAGDEELEAMVDILLRGIVKPKEIAAETGMNVERVYKLREKLDRAVQRVEKRIRGDAGGQECPGMRESNHGSGKGTKDSF